jgi:MSHA biogenesis protein MshP
MKRTSATSPERARGFALPAVIALLVVLALFGASLAVISMTQHSGAALDLQGVRAYQAARGGMEWGLFHLLRSGGLGCGGINGQSIDYAGSLAGFRATVQCSPTPHEEGAGNVTMYSLTVTACNDTASGCPLASPPAHYVERQLRVTVASN